jgi:LPS-assembly protein
MNFLRTLFCLTLMLSSYLTINSPALAQSSQKVGVIADRVSFDPSTQVLIADGNVRILSAGAIITTDSVIYDQRNGILTLPSDLEITQADGTILRASGADISSDLRNGLIRGATLVIESQFQLTAEETIRKDGRYTILNNGVASTCYICEDNEIPFWQIRSRRTVHDTETKRIYFERATLDFLGVPLIYVPKLRVPDPSVDRATGFLFPVFVQSSSLGYGVKTPYYIALGDHSDITLTPFLSTKGGLVLEGEFRQNFAAGSILATGALAYDNSAATTGMH